MREVVTFLKTHHKFAVFTHLNPDGDALGSAYALAQTLNNLGKSAEVILLCEPPAKYRFGCFERLYCLLPDVETASYDAAVSVDCATIKRLSDAQELFRRLPNCNIDHHISNTNYAQINYIADLPATGEIIWQLGEKLGAVADETVRMAIYMAISTDTGNFTYSNTKKTTLELFSRLVAEGLPLSKMAEQIFNRRSLGATKLIARFIDHIRLHKNGMMAISVLMLSDIEESGADVSDTEILIDYAREIEGVEIAAFIREMSRDTYKISLRANTYADVGELAAQFGGGGHVKAAGCMMKGNIYNVMEALMKAAENYLK